MPSRFLREAYITSPRIDSVSPECRDLWVRLLLQVDDYGRFHGDPRIVSSKCFPLSAHAGKCERMLTELASARLLLLYSVEGKQYLALTQWVERARSKPKFPEPPPMLADAEQLPATRVQLQTVANNCAPPSSSFLRLTPSPSSSAAEEKPNGTVRIGFDLSQGWTGIAESDVAAWVEAYPAVAIKVELAAAREWVKSHPANHKSNWRKFLTGWFKRSQDRAPPIPKAGGTGVRKVSL